MYSEHVSLVSHALLAAAIKLCLRCFSSFSAFKDKSIKVEELLKLIHVHVAQEQLF